ncbi:MAG TPA: anti-sigma factor [Propionibacteriaceae bacterium]|nr:anti-sigma factor [Propionibacteriaceae bacterium]
MSEIHGAVGSYVAHALDPDEQRDFEQHLAVCPTCAQEVQEFSETAAELSSLVQVPPPPALRAAVLSAIQQVRPEPPLPAQAPDRQRSEEHRPGGSPADEGRSLEEGRPSLTRRAEPVEAVRTTSATAASGAGRPPIDELRARRARRTTRLLSLAVAAAMVIALALGGWVVNLVQDRQAQTATAALEAQLLSAPDAKVYPATMAGGTPVSFVVSKSLGRAMFVGADVPDLADDKVYKLWTIPPGTGATPVGDSAFEGGRDRKVWVRGNVSDGSLAITVEENPETPVPTTDAVLVVKV